MKTKYTYTVAGQPLSFIADDDKEFVDAVVSETDKTVTDVMLGNLRCAKLDAALIAALDFCGEKTKLEKRLRSLEAQVSLYEATIARMKNVCNIDESGEPLDKGEQEPKQEQQSAPIPAQPETPAKAANKEKSPAEKLAEAARLLKQRQAKPAEPKTDGRTDEAILRLTPDDGKRESPKANEPAKEAKADEPRDKISELESILKLRREEKENEGRQSKLGEIEGLLKRE